MRRFRNPRYAPEFLERKLSPSGFTPPPADVSTSDPGDAPDVYDIPCGDAGLTVQDPPPVYDIICGDSPGDPPPTLPDFPEDPSGPAYTPDTATV